jgi:quercetin dioxygenase-like cupin family protein
MPEPLQLKDVLEAVAARTDAETPRGLAVVEVDVRAGHITPLHVHDEDEAVRVLEGSVVVRTADALVTLEAGDSRVAAAGEPHAVLAGPGGARYLTTSHVRSVERYEAFVRAVALPVSPTSGASFVEEERTLALVAEANGITVLGPPGTSAGRVAA